MSDAGGAVWAGLNPEGARMSAVATLRRFGLVTGGKLPLRLWVPAGIREIWEEAAHQEGWVLAGESGAEAVLIWMGEGRKVVDDRVEWVCRIGAGEAGGPSAVADLELVKSLPFRGYLSVNQLFGRAGRALRLAPGLCGWLDRGWARFGMDATAGAKMALLRIPGLRESYWRRGGSAVGKRVFSWGDAVCDGVATFGWTGHVPLAGALLASLLTAAAGWLSWACLSGEGLGPFRAVWAGVALAAALGCLLTESWAACHFLSGDPREVVLDETAGMAAALVFVPAGLQQAAAGRVALWFALAFVAFRLFDALKFGSRWVERTGWRGAIVWDDLLAGVYAGGTAWLIWSLFA